MLHLLQALAPAASTTGSAGSQDAKLARLLHGILGIEKGTFVEFGFPNSIDSNTLALEDKGWRGVRLDGRNNATAKYSCHAEWITSDNIVSLFQKYGVPAEVDYVSIVRAARARALRPHPRPNARRHMQGPFISRTALSAHAED